MNIRLIIALLGVYLAAMGCTDDNEQGSTGKNQEVNDSITPAWLAKYCYIENFLFKEQVDSHGDTIRVSAYGEVLSPITPTVYSLAVEDEDEAHRFFKEKCIPPSIDGIWEPDYDATTVDLGEMGTITYQPNSNNGAIASIVVDIPTLPELSRIDFVQKGVWPKNSTSIFKTGQIVMCNDTQELFMIVQECEGGYEGLMLNDGGVGISNILGTNWYVVGAEEDAWQGLLALATDEGESIMNNYFNVVADVIKKYQEKNEIKGEYRWWDIIDLQARLYEKDWRDNHFAPCGNPWKVRHEKNDVGWIKALYLDQTKYENGIKRYVTENISETEGKKQADGRSRSFNNSESKKYTVVFEGGF